MMVWLMRFFRWIFDGSVWELVEMGWSGVEGVVRLGYSGLIWGAQPVLILSCT